MKLVSQYTHHYWMLLRHTEKKNGLLHILFRLSQHEYTLTCRHWIHDDKYISGCLMSDCPWQCVSVCLKPFLIPSYSGKCDVNMSLFLICPLPQVPDWLPHTSVNGNSYLGFRAREDTRLSSDLQMTITTNCKKQWTCFLFNFCPRHLVTFYVWLYVHGLNINILCCGEGQTYRTWVVELTVSCFFLTSFLNVHWGRAKADITLTWELFFYLFV